LACACFLAFAALGCGEGATPRSSNAATAALTASERTHAARAIVYAAQVARYREAIAAERRQVAAYARWAPPPGKVVTTNWNDVLKATHESRAAAADQIAARIQTIADFHAAEAEREMGR
jgi:hypothetical protein